MPTDPQPVRAVSSVHGPHEAPWRDKIGFLRGFLRHPAQVGSVWPSSPALEQRLVAQAGIASARLVVELGPGTGGTTTALLQALPAAGRLLAVELDPQFHHHLVHSQQDHRLLLEHASAEQLEELLAARRLPPPDAIVSGIPFSTLSPAVAGGIAAMVARCLAPGGRFVAYQVRAHVERYASPHLGPAQRHWEWRNIPPVRVFSWTRPPC